MTETLFTAGLDQSQARLANYPCPFCGAIDWDVGYIAGIPVGIGNNDGNLVFPSQLILKQTLQSVIHTCQACHYQLSFTLRKPEYLGPVASDA